MPNTPRRSLRVPPELWNAFLAATASRNETATSALVRFMREDVARHKTDERTM